MADIMEWYNSIPLFTRHWFGASVFFPIAAKIGLLSPMSLIMTPQFAKNFHLWRPLTAVFYYPTGFHYLMNLFFLYNYSMRLETGPEYMGRPGDYFFLLIFCWVSSVLIGYIFNIHLLMDAMVLSVLYIWCQFNRDMIVNFWFGTRMKAMYLPFVLLGFNMLMGGGGLYEIIGILVGHLYYFIMIKYPADTGYRMIETPEIFHQWFPPTATQSGAAFFIPPRPGQGPGPRSDRWGHNWGPGRTLND